MKKYLFVLLSAGLLLVGMVGSAQDEEAESIRLEVEPSEVTLEVGQTLTLSAIARDGDGNLSLIHI